MSVIKIEKEDQHWQRFQEMPQFSRQVKTEIDASFLSCGFLVMKEEIEVARICCYLNPNHKIEGEQFGTIGYFECVEDFETFTLLMNSVVNHFKENGISQLLGPMDGSTWNEYRFISSHVDQTFLLEMNHPGYYLEFFRKYGFVKLAQYYSQKSDHLVHHWEKSKHQFDEFEKSGVTFHHFDKENAFEEFLKLGTFCNKAFQNNFLFSPISKEDFATKMLTSLPIINPRYTIFAKEGDVVVGFIFCYQDNLDTKNKTIVVKTVARSPENKYKGLGSVLSSLIMINAIEDGFTHSIHALILDSNISKHLSDKFEATYLRTYELLTYNI